MKRRNFLKMSASSVAGAAALGPLAWAPRAHAATITRTFYITDGVIPFPGQSGNGTPTNINIYFKGFSSSAGTLDVPGKPIGYANGPTAPAAGEEIVQEGDTVQITVHNTLNTTHAFEVDGIPGSSTGPIAPGGQATVSFTVNNAGTYIYHDPSNAPYNRLVGLHGAMIVLPAGSLNELYAGSPTFDQQLIWVMHDIDPVWHAAIQQGQTPSTAYLPRHFTLNGLYGRPPGAPGSGDKALDAMVATGTALHGHLNEPALLRVLNPGMTSHAVHTHGNHMRWLTSNGQVRPAIWEKDIVPMDGNMGKVDVIFPFDPPPDAWPPVTTGIYPMHLHDEMTQTSAGGYYMFGTVTDIYFE